MMHKVMKAKNLMHMDIWVVCEIFKDFGATLTLLKPHMLHLFELSNSNPFKDGRQYSTKDTMCSALLFLYFLCCCFYNSIFNMLHLLFWQNFLKYFKFSFLFKAKFDFERSRH